MESYPAKVELIPRSCSSYRPDMSRPSLAKVRPVRRERVIKPDQFFLRSVDERFRRAKEFEAANHLADAEMVYRELLLSFERARQNPAAILSSLGFTLLGQNRLEEAERVLLKSLKHNPDQVEAHANLGGIYRLTNRYKEAEYASRRALEIQPDQPQARLNLAFTNSHHRRYSQAAQDFLLCLALDPNNIEALKGLAGTYVALGETDVAIPMYRKAMETDVASWGVQTHLLFALQYDPTIPNEEVKAEHVSYGRVLRNYVGPARTEFTNSRSIDRKIKLGYYSSDFNQHVTMLFIEKAIEHHDRDRFEICCIQNNKSSDIVTERIKKQADLWLDISNIADDKDAQKLITEHEIDIVVDTTSHTSTNRLALFAHRVAPIQATWCGYSGTSGVDTMDYIIVDPIIAPEGEPHFFVEEPLRLPSSYLCFTSASEIPVGPLPFDHNGFITFGCLNNPCKINQHVVHWWAKILEQVPKSKIILRYTLYNDPLVSERIHRMFRNAGIPIDRYDILCQGGADFLATYRFIDIALDAFPYNGTTTTSEALWMGVPVITLYGDRFVARVGASLMFNAGLSGLIGETPEEYIQQAVRLAGDPERLGTIRSKLREHLVTTPVFNPKLWTPGLDEAYSKAFRTWATEKS